MSGFIPMLSASPPPMDNSFEMDDDDEDEDASSGFPTKITSSSSSGFHQSIPPPGIGDCDDDDDDDFGDFAAVLPPFCSNQVEKTTVKSKQTTHSKPDTNYASPSDNFFNSAPPLPPSFDIPIPPPVSNTNFTPIPDFGDDQDVNRNPKASSSSTSSSKRTNLTLSAVSENRISIDDDDEERFMPEKPSTAEATLNNAPASSNASAKSSPTTTCSSSTQITAFDGSDAGVEAVSLTASDCGVEAISLADSGLCSDASPVPKSAYESPAQDPGIETFEHISVDADVENDGHPPSNQCDLTFEESDDIVRTQIPVNDDDDDDGADDDDVDVRDDTTLISGDLKMEVLINSLLNSDSKKDDEDDDNFGSGTARPNSFLRVDRVVADAEGKMTVSETPSEASSPQRLLGNGSDDGKRRTAFLQNDDDEDRGKIDDDDFREFQMDIKNSAPNLDEMSGPFTVAKSVGVHEVDNANDVYVNNGVNVDANGVDGGAYIAVNISNNGANDAAIRDHLDDAFEDGGEDAILKEIDSALGGRVLEETDVSLAAFGESALVADNDDGDDFAAFGEPALVANGDDDFATFGESALVADDDGDDFADFSCAVKEVVSTVVGVNIDDDFADFSSAVKDVSSTKLPVFTIEGKACDDEDDFGDFPAPPPSSTFASSAVDPSATLAPAAAASPPSVAPPPKIPPLPPATESIPESSQGPSSSSFVALKERLKPNEITWDDDDDDDDDRFRFDDIVSNDDDEDVIAPPPIFQSNPFKSADDDDENDFQGFADFATATAADVSSTTSLAKDPASESSEATETFLSHKLCVEEPNLTDQTSPTRTCLLASAATNADNELEDDDENEEDDDSQQVNSSRGHLNPFSAKDEDLVEDQFVFESKPHGAVEEEEEDEEEWNAFGGSSKEVGGGEDEWGNVMEWGETGVAATTANGGEDGWAKDGETGWGQDNDDDDGGWASFGSPAVPVEASVKLPTDAESFDNVDADAVGNNIEEDTGEDEWADFPDTKQTDKSQSRSSSTSSSPPSRSFLSSMSPSIVSSAMTDCFPSDVDHLNFAFDSPEGIPKKPVPKPDISLDNGLNVLSKLVDIDTALAISYHWLKTSMKNQLFWAVGVDNRNIMTAPHKKQVPIFASGLGNTVLEPNKGASSSAPSHSSHDTLQQQQSQSQQQPQQTQSTASTTSLNPTIKTTAAKQLPAVHPAPPELPPSLSGAAKSRATLPPLQQPPCIVPDAAAVVPQQMLVDTSGSKALGAEDMKRMADSKPLDRIKKESIPPVQFDWRTSGLQNPLDTFESEAVKESPSESSTRSLRSSTKDSMIKTLEAEMLEDVSNGSTPAVAKHVVTLHPLLAKLQSNNSNASFLTSSKNGSSTNLCLEVSSLLHHLPDLKFMRAQVLMFPVHSDPVHSDPAHAQQNGELPMDDSPTDSTTNDSISSKNSTLIKDCTTTTTTKTTTTNTPLQPGVCTISYS